MTRESITLFAGRGLLCLTLTVLASVNFGNFGGYGIHLPFNLLVIAGSVLAFSILTTDFLIRGERWQAGPSMVVMALLLFTTLLLSAVQSALGLEFYVGLRIASLLFMMLALLAWPTLTEQRTSVSRFWQLDLLSLLVAMAMVLVATGVLPFVLVPVIYGDALNLSLPYVFGVFQQANVMGSMAVMGLAALLALADSPKPALSGPLRITAAFMFGLAIVYLQSRTTYLAALLVLGIKLLSKVESVALDKKRIFEMSALVIGVWLGLLALTQADSLRRGAELLTDSSGSKRVEIWSISLDMVQEHPLIGNGIGNFTNTFVLAQADRYQKDGIYGFHNVNHPHNELLLWLVEGGVVYGFVLVGGVLWLIWRWQRAQPLSVNEWGLVIAAFIHSLTEYPLHFSVPHMLGLAVIVGYIEQRRHLLRPVALNHPKPWAFAILGGGLLVSLFFVASFVGLWQLTQTMMANVDVRERIQRFQVNYAPYLYRDLIDLNAQITFLDYAHQSKQPQLAQHYIGWAEQISSEEKYRWTRLYHLAVAKLMVGDQEGAKKTLAFLDYLYPPSIVPPQEMVVAIDGYPQAREEE